MHYYPSQRAVYVCHRFLNDALYTTWVKVRGLRDVGLKYHACLLALCFDFDNIDEQTVYYINPTIIRW